MAKRNGGNRRTGRDAAPVRPLPPGASAKTGQSGARSCLIVFAVVLALICLLAASVARCTTTSESSPDSRFFHFGSEGTYDWTCLNTVNGRYAYYADGTRLSRFGIDVSDSQGYIEWADVAVLGEVGLAGEVRAIPQCERRLAECKRLGFTTVILPRENLRRLKPDEGLRLVGVDTVMQAASVLF